MCPPLPSTKLPNFPPEKESSGGKNISLIVKLPLVAALLAFFLQLAISEFLTGWTNKYTSPIYFSTTKNDWASLLFKTVHHIPDMSGKVAIVTGSNTGIGFETALELARAGAQVIVAARSKKKGLDAVDRIRKEISVEDDSSVVQYLNLDLSSLASVATFAKEFDKLRLDLHVLFLNAGVMKSPGQQFIGETLTSGFEVTDDGFEYHIGVNHIGHAYLTKLLLNNLKNTAKKSSEGSRIISTSSMAEGGAPESGFQFNDWRPTDGVMPATYEDGVFYGQSKLANLMYTNELSDRLNNTGVSVYSCHPGVITTELSRYLEQVFDERNADKGVFVKTLTKAFGAFFNSALFDARGGALTQLHIATADRDGLVNGGFYHPVGREMQPLHPQAQNLTLRKMLWSETEKAINSHTDSNWVRKLF